MNDNELLPIDRFLATLEIVSREGRHLHYSYGRLFSSNIDEAWVKRLDVDPELAEGLEAFVSRFGRMQDTMADKLLPRWLLALAETPGSQIETLNKAEKLGVIESVEQWLQARRLRNVLIHEYMVSEADFAVNLLQAKQYCQLFTDCFNRVRDFSEFRMGIDKQHLPAPLTLRENEQ